MLSKQVPRQLAQLSRLSQARAFSEFHRITSMAQQQPMPVISKEDFNKYGSFKVSHTFNHFIFIPVYIYRLLIPRSIQDKFCIQNHRRRTSSGAEPSLTTCSPLTGPPRKGGRSPRLWLMAQFSLVSLLLPFITAYLATRA